MTVLPDAEWRQRPGLARVVAALCADGGAVRYVGGAVRDTVLGMPVTDVDLATPLRPDAVIARLNAAAIKAVPTGIAHGTVTAVADGMPYEITTLRRDVATDGRHATIVFADEWRDDAARRDFTINALYADPASGEIFDWFGGQEDLVARRVRFIGDAATRIAEDHLRILRFYRFAARFGSAAPDPVSRAAAVAARQTLRSLSRERVADELMKLLALPDPALGVAWMTGDGVLAEILPEISGDAAARLARLLANEAGTQTPPDGLRRFACLLDSRDAAETVGSRLRLSNKARARLRLLVGAGAQPLLPAPRAMAYRFGAASARDLWLLYGQPAELTQAWTVMSDWTPPKLPIKGGEIVARGVAAGPAVAALLAAIEDQWVTEDFPGSDRVATIADQLVALAIDARQ